MPRGDDQRRAVFAFELSDSPASFFSRAVTGLDSGSDLPLR